MSQPLFDNLTRRGFFNQCTNEEGLAAAIIEHQQKNLPFAVYLGIDPTASSLHIGHTLPLYMLKHLQELGLKIVVLMGGGTGRIGDPSGKNQARKLLDDQLISSNIANIKTQCMRFFAGDAHVEFVNNADWLNDLRYIDFLRDIGRHFSVNRMLSFDTYASRLESGLSFLEFNYQLLQSYDFAQLFEHHHCKLQIGGQDQWGNIVSGIDLIRRLHGAEAFGLTCPLIMTATGQKMGKSEQGAIFLDANLTSPSEFYQYWRNCSDKDVNRFLKLFTFLPVEECEALTADKDAHSLSRAKDRLAFEATKIIHGIEIAQQVQQQVTLLFSKPLDSDNSPEARIERVRAIIASARTAQAAPAHKEVHLPPLLESIKDSAQQLLNTIDEAIPGTSDYLKSMPKLIQASSGGIATGTLDRGYLEAGITLADLFVQSGLAGSKGEYRKKLVAAKAAFYNEQAIEQSDMPITQEMFIDDSILLRAGKKRYYLFTLQ